MIASHSDTGVAPDVYSIVVLHLAWDVRSNLMGEKINKKEKCID